MAEIVPAEVSDVRVLQHPLPCTSKVSDWLADDVAERQSFRALLLTLYVKPKVIEQGLEAICRNWYLPCLTGLRRRSLPCQLR